VSLLKPLHASPARVWFGRGEREEHENMISIRKSDERRRSKLDWLDGAKISDESRLKFAAVGDSEFPLFDLP
jgi:hypothetical protein